MCDSNYVSLKNYNSSKKESFEINSGFIDIGKGSAPSTLKVTSSDISRSVLTWESDDAAKQAAIAAAKATGGVQGAVRTMQVSLKPFYRQRGEIAHGSDIPTVGRFSVRLDKVPLNTELTSVEVFTKNIDGFWAPNSNPFNFQFISYDSSTQLLHIGYLATDLQTIVFKLQNLSAADGGLIRIVVTW
jgi:hypothetical protein